MMNPVIEYDSECETSPGRMGTVMVDELLEGFLLFPFVF